MMSGSSFFFFFKWQSDPFNQKETSTSSAMPSYIVCSLPKRSAPPEPDSKLSLLGEYRPSSDSRYGHREAPWRPASSHDICCVIRRCYLHSELLVTWPFSQKLGFQDQYARAQVLVLPPAPCGIEATHSTRWFQPWLLHSRILGLLKALQVILMCSQH